MCGIAGILDFEGRGPDADRLRRMGRALAHRGPDGFGIYRDAQIGLVHRRLSIQDLSEAGRQPMADPAGRAIVSYNGELYNTAELKAELHRDFGVTFRSTGDTEVLPHAYLAWGEDMVDRLEGMFAFALWDTARQRLLLARDGIGIKPVWMARTASSFAFASEPKALFEAGASRDRLDPSALHTFLAAGHPGPDRSLFEDITPLGAGTWCVVDGRDGNESRRRFWAPRRVGGIASERDAVELVGRTVGDVVASQLISDVPLGVLQSGGIDSTVISLAVARGHHRAPLFTATFGSETFDEIDAAREVAAVAGLPLHEVQIGGQTDVAAAFVTAAHHADGQMADTGFLAFYELSRAVRRHTTVVLSGDGGDEFFCGYETYRATLAAERVRWIPPVCWAAAGRLGYHLARQNEHRLPAVTVLARFGLGMASGGRHPHVEWRRLLPAFMTERVYGPALQPALDVSPLAAYGRLYDEAIDAGSSVLDAAMHADQWFHLPSIIAKVDLMSMAHSLEVRVPLLDRRVMEVAGRIDAALHYPRGGRRKHVLRHVAAALGAPASVTERGKTGFNVPIAALMRGALAPVCEHVFERHADTLAPYLAADPVRRLWRDHRAGRANHAFALWPLAVLGAFRAGMAPPSESRPSEVAVREYGPEHMIDRSRLL